MKLSEIAEFIVEHNPDCCMAVNHEILKGCRENWYEESLVDTLMNYYMYEELWLCGCGCPEYTYEVIRRYLHIRDSRFENHLNYEDVCKMYKINLHIDNDDSIQYGLLQFMMYALDQCGFTEHGSSIGGCWITDKGGRLLTVLDAWYEREGEQVLEMYKL